LATPVGHALAGVAWGALVGGRRPWFGPWRDVMFFAALAMAPDLDFLPGLVIGRPEAFHHGVSHSLGFALLFGGLMAWWGARRGAPWRWGLLGAGMYFLQVLLDWLTLDTSPPRGVPLWWPWSGHYFMAEPWLFDDVRRRPLAWATLWHDIKAAGWEVVVLGPAAGVALWWRGRGLRAAKE